MAQGAVEDRARRGARGRPDVLPVYDGTGGVRESMGRIDAHVHGDPDRPRDPKAYVDACRKEHE